MDPYLRCMLDPKPCPDLPKASHFHAPFNFVIQFLYTIQFLCTIQFLYAIPFLYASLMLHHTSNLAPMVTTSQQSIDTWSSSNCMVSLLQS